ncbi:MAG: hypothetical protein AAF416_04055 [Pseudomonadota bacterium]
MKKLYRLRQVRKDRLGNVTENFARDGASSVNVSFDGKGTYVVEAVYDEADETEASEVSSPKHAS